MPPPPSSSPTHIPCGGIRAVARGPEHGLRGGAGLVMLPRGSEQCSTVNSPVVSKETRTNMPSVWLYKPMISSLLRAHHRPSLQHTLRLSPFSILPILRSNTSRYDEVLLPTFLSSLYDHDEPPSDDQVSNQFTDQRLLQLQPQRVEIPRSTGAEVRAYLSYKIRCCQARQSAPRAPSSQRKARSCHRPNTT